MNKLTLAEGFPAADEAAWLALVEKALRGADFEETLVSRTDDGLRLKPLYSRADERPSTGLPGAAPYVRGLRTTPDEPPWDIRQLHAHSDPAAANANILGDLNGGVTSIVLQVDGPGQFGVVINNADDFERALDGVHLDLAPIAFAPGERSRNCSRCCGH